MPWGWHGTENAVGAYNLAWAGHKKKNPLRKLKPERCLGVTLVDPALQAQGTAFANVLRQACMRNRERTSVVEQSKCGRQQWAMIWSGRRGQATGGPVTTSGTVNLTPCAIEAEWRFWTTKGEVPWANALKKSEVSEVGDFMYMWLGPGNLSHQCQGKRNESHSLAIFCPQTLIPKLKRQKMHVLNNGLSIFCISYSGLGYLWLKKKISQRLNISFYLANATCPKEVSRDLWFTQSLRDSGWEAAPSVCLLGHCSRRRGS